MRSAPGRWFARRSGKSELVVATRLACNRYLADAVQQWAFCSLRCSSWAREFYDTQRLLSRGHHAALPAPRVATPGLLTVLRATGPQLSHEVARCERLAPMCCVRRAAADTSRSRHVAASGLRFPSRRTGPATLTPWFVSGGVTSLRVTAGLGEAGIIDRVGERYQADATLINCDLWRFEIALTEAAATTDDAAGIEALERAAVAYGGDLCDGAYYEWVEASREDLRRRAVDATARLAELRQAAGDSDGALDALDMAIRHDPYAEELYRRIMRLQADLGRTDAVRRTYRLLETRLTDLDIEPDDATNRLLTDLLAER